MKIDFDSLVEIVSSLPDDKVREVLDFVQFLSMRDRSAKEQLLEPVSWANDPLWDIVGLGESGVTDGAVEHDRYLYGEGHSCKTASYWQLREKGGA